MLDYNGQAADRHDGEKNYRQIVERLCESYRQANGLTIGATSLTSFIEALPDQPPMVLLIDEADGLLAADRACNWKLYGELRVLSQSGRCQCVLAGEVALRQVQQDADTPFFNFAHDLTIGHFDRIVVGELFTRPMEQIGIKVHEPERSIAALISFTGGHPNVVQRLCARLVAQLHQESRRILTPEDTQKVIYDPTFQRDDFLNTYFQRAAVLERIIMLLLTQAGQPRTRQAIRQRLDELGVHVSIKELEEALQLLVTLRGILEYTQEGYRCVIGGFTTVLGQSILARDELQQQLDSYTVLAEPLPACSTAEQWRTLLLALGQVALRRQRLLAIALDEMGRLPVSWRESFLSLLCEIRDSRAKMPAFIAITFLFVGAFRPEAMISDWNVSPFNKAKPLSLPDFTAAQIAELLEHSGVAQDLAARLTPRLVYWTDGQPYLVQRLCEILFAAPQGQVTLADIDRAVSILERRDQIHISAMFEKLRSAKQLCQRAERILDGAEVEYAPASLKWQAELTSIGLIKEQRSTGRCIIRNPIYARAFRRFLLDQRENITPADLKSDCTHLMKLRATKRQRYQQLEVDAARFGPHTPAYLSIELHELGNELAGLNEQILMIGCHEPGQES